MVFELFLLLPPVIYYSEPIYYFNRFPYNFFFKGRRTHIKYSVEHSFRGESFRSRFKLGQARPQQQGTIHFKTDETRSTASHDPGFPFISSRFRTFGQGELRMQRTVAGSHEISFDA